MRQFPAKSPFTQNSAQARITAIFENGDFSTAKAGGGVTKAADLALYAGYRISSGTTPFSYAVPLANGTYTVTLGFLEPSKTMAVGGRVFNVEANGTTMLSNIDVLKESGVYRTVIAPKSFTVTVTNGKLNLNFKPIVGGAVVSNIAIVKQ